MDCDFSLSALKEEDVFNDDNSPVVNHLHDNRKIAQKGKTSVQEADFVSADEEIELVLKLGGGRNSIMCTQMFFFDNGIRSYQIRGLQDDVSRVTYRSSPKGWMSRSL